MRHACCAEGSGFLLRPLVETDIEALRVWRNNPANTACLRRLPFITEEMQRRWFSETLENPDELAFAIEETGRGLGLIGSVSLYHFADGEAEFGRLLIGMPEAHGTGAGKTAVSLLLFIGFGILELTRIYAHVHPDNAAARKSYARAGLTETGTDGAELIVEIRRSEYEALVRAKTDPPIISDSACLLRFQRHGDARGFLVAAEACAEIPFPVKRAFWIYGCEREAVRGCHANRRSEFVLIALHGACQVKVVSAYGEKRYLLNSPQTGLYLPRMTWKEMYDFAPDTTLLCLASERYDTEEYIRDFDAFMQEVKHE